MNEQDDRPEPGPDQPATGSAEPPKIIHAQALFDGEREICIEHAGEMYRLRITRRNKLILQK